MTHSIISTLLLGTLPTSLRSTGSSGLLAAGLLFALLIPLSAADFPVTSGVNDKTSEDYTMNTDAGTLELRDPGHRWIWFTHFTRPGDFTVSAKVAVAQANADAVLRLGHWVPQRGEASSAEAALAATDSTADINPQWQILGTIHISTPGDHTLFARMVSQAGPAPGQLHAIRIDGPGTVTSATQWEARTSACDPKSSGTGDLRRARFLEVIPRPWPLPDLGATFTTCNAPGGYLGCQEDSFFWSSWNSNGISADLLVAFAGTRAYSHEGSGVTISLDDFSLPLDRRRQTLILQKPDGSGTTSLGTILVGEAGQGWHLLGRMRRPNIGTVSSVLGFLENPSTRYSNLHRRSSAWGNPWFFSEDSGSHAWRQAEQLKAPLRGPSPTGPPPLPHGVYPWGETRLNQDMMEMVIGGQIPIAQNVTYFPNPAAPFPALPTLNLAYNLADEDHVHQAPDTSTGSSYSATLATLIRDPFSTLDFTFVKIAAPSWLTVASDGSLGGTPGVGDAGQNLLTVTATDPDAGLSGVFTVGIYVQDNGNNPPAFLDHPTTMQVAATIGGTDVLALRFYDPDAGDTHTLAITGGNSGNTFTIDQTRGMLVKNTAPTPDTTWNLTLSVTDDGAPAASDTLTLTITSGPTNITGGAFSELWTIMRGSTVADLTSDPRYPDNPTVQSMIGALEDEGPGKNTGTRVRGWIHPPTTADYTFWISGEHAAEFHLSSDNSPANLAKTCESTSATSFREYDKKSEQQSATIPLVAGQRYYFEVLQKNDGTTGSFNGSYSVAWEGPGITREPVPANALSAWRHLTPAFFSDTITLRPVVTGEPYLEFLKTKLRTLYSHTGIAHSKISGPAWLHVAPDGTLTGTPGPGDAGTNSFSMRTTASGGLITESTFLVEVSANQAPQFAAGPIVLPTIDESTPLPLDTSIAGEASDPDVGPRFGTGDQLSFSLATAPPWLHITPDGLLFGTPSAADIGLNNFTIAATDLGGLTTLGTAQIIVNDVDIAPIFVADPIQINALPGTVFSDSLASYAYDPDAGETLTFDKLTGPAWLHFMADGTISGTPGSTHLGLNSFTVEVRDSLNQSDTTTIEIFVQNPDPAVYEGFEGTAGSAVDGFGSGTGWAAGSNWSSDNGATTFGTPNTFPGLTSLGQSAAFSVSDGLQRDLNFLFTLGDAPGEYSELWLSFSLDNPGPIAVGHGHQLVLQDNGNDLLAFGKEANNKWLLRGGDVSVDFTTNGASRNLGNWFAVVRLTFDGSDTIATAWLAEDSDPGIDISDPTTFPRTGSVTLPGSTSFNGVALHSHNTSTARLDEIAIAANYPRLATMAADTDNDGDPNFSDPDDDGDGIPDSWEALYAVLDPLVDDAALDPDGDGCNNWYEYITDTDPGDSNSKQDFTIVLAPGTGEPTLWFHTSTSRLYTVETHDDLTTGDWQDLVPTVQGTGGKMAIPDPTFLSPRFYRLHVKVP